ncbi:hypothetical protein D9M68_554080 [compost metagenome]
MRGDDLAHGDVRQRLAQALRDVFVGQPVEAVAAHPFLVQALGQRVAVGHVAVAAVECGVEARHLRDPGPAFADDADRSQVVRLVQRRQRREGIQLCQDFVVDQHRLGQVGAAMHHPVPNRQRRAAQVAAQPGADHFLGVGHVGRVAGRDFSLDQGLAGRVAHPQPRPRGADAFKLAPQARGKFLRAVDVVQIELDAGTAGVDDENGVGHGAVIPR